jgi:hypothetical protein
MSSTYYPAADPGDHEHEIIKNTADAHNKYGLHLGILDVGTPGLTKSDFVYRPIFHLTLPDEGKVAADVSWAKLWLYCYSRVGSPEGLTYHLARVTQYDWYDYYTHGLGPSLDYTCYQHSGAAWATLFGDYSTPQADFAGPATTGWFSVDITDLIKDAITNHTRDLNALIWVGDQASTAWYFSCKHSSVTPSLKWHVEVEWAAPAAAGRNWGQVF